MASYEIPQGVRPSGLFRGGGGWPRQGELHGDGQGRLWHVRSERELRGERPERALHRVRAKGMFLSHGPLLTPLRPWLVLVLTTRHRDYQWAAREERRLQASSTHTFPRPSAVTVQTTYVLVHYLARATTTTHAKKKQHRLCSCYISNAGFALYQPSHPEIRLKNVNVQYLKSSTWHKRLQWLCKVRWKCTLSLCHFNYKLLIMELDLL